MAKRSYDTDFEFNSDLYKLEVSTFQKNVALPMEEPRYEPVEHCHFYHTMDSNGKACDSAAAVGGHFHFIKKIEKKYGKDDVAEYVCSPAMFIRNKKVGRSMQRVAMEQEHDKHVHNIVYLKSNRIKKRSMSEDAMKVMGALANKEAGLSDVEG